MRTLVEMAVAMARHANTPRRFMNLAMKFAVKLLNRLFTRMPDGSTVVPLWRYKGTKVPLNLNRFHPWGCAAHVHVEKKKRTRFEPKSTPCVFFGYDDAASAAILAKLPDFTSCPLPQIQPQRVGTLLLVRPGRGRPFHEVAGQRPRETRASNVTPGTELSPPMYPLPGCYPENNRFRAKGSAKEDG